MADISYVVKKHYGVIGDTGNGWKKELNLISWNGRAPKIDIREWSGDKSKMKKGITLSLPEFSELMKLVSSVDVGDMQTDEALNGSLG